ncbi:MAG: hypothetical protein ACFFER_12025 [Candidatus Thorarchaeota archaeon]
MFKRLVFCFILLAIPYHPIPAIDSTNNDIVLFSGSYAIPINGSLIFNHTLERNTGYYGSYDCSGTIKFGIVGLDGYFEGSDDARLYSEFNSSQPRWEFPCDVDVNASFVYQSFAETEIALDYEIVQDITPIEAVLKLTWITNYPPKLEVNASFAGGFFSRARGTFYPQASNESLGYEVHFSQNNTAIWTAGEYPYRKGRFDEYPDGSYNLTLTIYDVFDQETFRYFEFTKNTQRNSILILSGLIGLFAAAYFIEIVRRRYFD